MIAKNRKAFFEYFILDTYEAGIVLKGTEIKSARAGKLSFSDSFCMFLEDGLYIRNMHIAEYSKASVWNHEPKRDRKLLLNKRELKKLRKAITGTGMTIVPLKAFISKRGYMKIEIGLAKGKKLYDKRISLKTQDDAKRMRDRE